MNTQIFLKLSMTFSNPYVALIIKKIFHVFNLENFLTNLERLSNVRSSMKNQFNFSS